MFNIYRTTKSQVLIAASLFVSANLFAENILFETDLESGTIEEGVGSPLWAIKEDTTSSFGPGNFFEVTTTTSHSGKYSLRFNYEGRNGKCNTCGFKNVAQKAGYDSISSMIDDEGQDLTLDPFLASANRIIFNNDNAYSKWRIVSIENQDTTNDKLTLEKLADGIGGVPGKFSAGDSISIARQCGVDGTVGGNIDRKSDCNKAITYFSGVSQTYGESIFRRVYLKADIKEGAPYHQKLQYWTPQTGASIVLFGEYYTNMSPYVHILLTGLMDKGGLGAYRPAGANFLPGVWYYVEQEFKAQSGSGRNDGTYRLWFAEAGKETNDPLIEVTNLELPPVKNASLWGNHQHAVDSKGYWYMDDIKLSTSRIGPTTSTGTNISPPNPPTIQ